MATARIEKPESKISPSGRVASASTGAVLTSLILTPFDVVKTRMQSQLRHHPTVECENCRTPVRRWDGLAEAWCLECDVQTTANAGNSAGSLKLGPTQAAKKLIQTEGLSSLWRGWSTTIVRSVPQVVIYYSLYEYIKDQLFTKKFPKMPFIPLWSGSLARTITTFVVSPIDLVRTKQQAFTKKTSAFEILQSEIQKKKGILNLWRGATPTLWRDVLFSGIYWSGFESIREKILVEWRANRSDISHERKRQLIVSSSFIAGGTSGSIAAVLTHPFDVVLTRRQVELYDLDPNRKAKPSSTMKVMKTIIKEEGYAGLWTGWAPRVLKITPSCAIMISTYEFAKAFFGTE